MHDKHSDSCPPAGDAAAGNAALAARRLDTSEDHSLSPYTNLGERQLAALQGIGYALLAIADQLADANDTAADAATHLEQLAMAAGEPASPPAGMAADLAPRPEGRRHDRRAAPPSGTDRHFPGQGR
jgi:hypothetical protein